MENLNSELQNYLKTKEIIVQEAKKLCRFKTKEATFGENVKSDLNISIAYLLCQIQ